MVCIVYQSEYEKLLLLVTTLGIIIGHISELVRHHQHSYNEMEPYLSVNIGINSNQSAERKSAQYRLKC